MKQKWMVHGKRADFKKIGEALGIDQVTARILRNRDLISEEEIDRFLNGDLTKLHSPFLLKDLDKGAKLILEAIEKKQSIRIIGDYDIDGVTSTYILYHGIQELGGVVSYAIPDRVADGYGLNVNLIQKAYEEGVSVILTCDNGIAAVDAIKKAKELGMTVVVTDHHNIPYDEEEGERIYKIPEADAVIDPKLIDSTYPFQEICGAMVAFKFVIGMWSLAGYDVDIEKNKKLKHLLIFACIGTIGDIMPLMDENRIVVKYGLEELHKTKDQSLVSFIEACELNQQSIGTYHVGFILGPCINASGRLKTADFAMELFLSKEKKQCDLLAKDLVDLNKVRKNLTEEYTKEAIAMVKETALKDDRVLVVYLPECHESIAGIIAGRVKEAFYRPTLVVTKSEQGLKGSGRSIEAYPMFDELSKVKDLLSKFGGHAMAAGFSLEEHNLNELRKKLNQNCTLSEEDLQQVVYIDVPMPLDYVTPNLIEEFEKLKPFGVGNPQPLFAQKNVRLVAATIMGKNKNVLRVKLQSETGNYFDGISFMEPSEFESFLLEKYSKETVDAFMLGKAVDIYVSICYQPGFNEFRGVKSIQFRVVYFAHV